MLVFLAAPAGTKRIARNFRPRLRLPRHSVCHPMLSLRGGFVLQAEFA
jgi:hypothetical protein